MTAQSIKYIIIISTGSVSLIASCTMSIIISCSTKGLNSPYRRIIFCLSCSDILQSLSIILGPFVMPKETTASIAPWAIGNRATCAADGFVFANAINFVEMYTCFLCIYYVCKLHWRMSDDKFRNCVEWVLHLSIFLINLPLTITALSLDLYHATSYGFCNYNEKHYHEELPGCGSGSGTNSQGEECDIAHHNTSWKVLMLIGTFAIPSLAYLVMICCAILLSRHAILKKREVKLDEENLSMAENCGDNRKMNIQMMSINGVPPRPLRKKGNRESAQMRLNKVEALSSLYRRETLTQALLFVVSFTIIYIMIPYLAIIPKIVHGSDFSDLNDITQIIVVILFPLGGMLNILVYCRPKVAALRRRENGDGNGKSVSWVRGFLMVVAAGGEIPKENDEDVAEIPKENEETNYLHSKASQPSFYGHSLAQNSAEESEFLYRGDGMEWFMGGYYIEEEALDEITYARNFEQES